MRMPKRQVRRAWPGTAPSVRSSAKDSAEMTSEREMESCEWNFTDSTRASFGDMGGVRFVLARSAQRERA